jgi:hypothetical protein
VRLARRDVRDHISNTAKSTADARIDSTDLAAAGIANMHHLRDFRSPAIFEFFNTIRQEQSVGVGRAEGRVWAEPEKGNELGPAKSFVVSMIEPFKTEMAK